MGRIAFARISNCFCPNFGKKQWEIRAKAMEIRAKAMEIWAKAMGKFGQKQWENSESSGIYFEQKLLLLPEFPIDFHCFCPNFLLVFSRFSPLLFARISHCFCPNFPLLFARIFRFHNFFLGGTVLPLPPPPTPMVLSVGLGNEDKVPCPMALLPRLPADSNMDPHDWEYVVLSTDPQRLLLVSLLTFYLSWLLWMLQFSPYVIISRLSIYHHYVITSLHTLSILRYKQLPFISL